MRIAPVGRPRAQSALLVCALAFRALSAIVALFAVLAFPLDHSVPPESTFWGPPSPFWDAMVRHDSDGT